MDDRAICDTSPIVALHRIGRLDLIAVAASQVIVPAAVVKELDAREPSDGASAAIRAIGSVRVVADAPVADRVQTYGLGSGEGQVLSQALALAPARAIVDDLAARRCAAALRIPVVGTIGLVVLARRRGVVSTARPLLLALVDAGLRVSPNLIRDVLDELGE